MPGPQVEKLYERISQAMPRFSDLDSAVDSVRLELDTLCPGLAVSLTAEIEEAKALIVKQFEQVQILDRYSVIADRPKWYFGSKPSDFHWPAVYGYLLNGKGWNQADVEGIHLASNEVVSLLENPKQPQFSCRGLVLGYVQSGKTANMTATIAKALDAGYNTVIVLAGLTNALRYQTQLRFFDDLIARNPLNWQVLTPNELERDFRAPPQGGFLSHTDKAQLAVIKKNVSPLGELKLAIERTMPAVLSKLRVLVIDDECDQASVNSARGEFETTVINERIREIISLLPAVSYVGYTATPFANVLIDPYRQEGQVLDDLYPRDFITALPLPASYFGTERLFGKVPVDPENVLPEEEGLDMIREINVGEVSSLQPRSRKERDNFQPLMTDSLRQSILYFLACCAARRIRGQLNKHMTMLVHTSAYVTAHERVSALIEGWVEVNHKAILDSSSAVGKELEAIWRQEQGKLPHDICSEESVDIVCIFDELPNVLSVLEFPIENGGSDDRIDYTGNAKTYIVVGGSILARGLTLEGLTVSFFLRTADQYDTLLQMGRWFGYRPGYEDLPRIWMPETLKLRFRELASIEREIRSDIEQYRIRQLTPMNIAVRIRSIPGMAITAATKMRAARKCAVSYWGTHRQTFRFEHTNFDKLRANWGAAAELVSRADALELKDDEAAKSGRHIWRNVPRSSIQRFLEKYEPHVTHADLNREMLIPFILGDNVRLREWNVAIVQPKKGASSFEPLGSVGNVSMVKRSKLDGSGDADIKALMSKNDVVYDCNDEVALDGGWEELKAARREKLGEVPLLLLYAIDPESTPVQAGTIRKPLNAAMDVLAYGIVFPGSVTESGSFVSVELRSLSAEDIEEIASEEAAQLQAAGV
ncbi:Z1 domain-containing protein [Pseudomonas sp. CC120222-01a]|uniref:Z1 domain-containing protein n=1 Tax=Pseudomonas sp. CC120222-01a TaxID=1378075 RepID=UPI000D85C046|nr:Z1 domain-containing protein [Pseudomonas sp. CC120222-01a]PVZ41310.1 Z1 domain-containing protein [Pseudomonas sp. CC120222-01a]